jgi:hypothetical protein
MVLLQPNISKETTIITPTSKFENCLKKNWKEWRTKNFRVD